VQEEDGRRKIVMCGGEMSSHELIPCASCGELFTTKKHLEFIKKRADTDRKIKYPRNLCPSCSKKIRAENIAGNLAVY
jgi:hypothetical protein